MTKRSLTLKVFTPSGLTITEQVYHVKAEDSSGFFGILPGHVPFLTPLVPGVITFRRDDGEERFIAIDSGLLVAEGDVVRIAVREALEGDDLISLRDQILAKAAARKEQEARARAAFSRLKGAVLKSG